MTNLNCLEQSLSFKAHCRSDILLTDHVMHMYIVLCDTANHKIFLHYASKHTYILVQPYNFLLKILSTTDLCLCTSFHGFLYKNDVQ